MAVVIFLLGAAASLVASAVLVTRLERLGQRVGAPEAMLGLITALAADSPEISVAVAAVAGGRRDVGVGVVLGSNVFNLAALLGLSAVVARRIVLHRRVVIFEGGMAVWVAAMATATMAHWTTPRVGLALTLVVFVPYVIVSALPARRRRRLPLPRPWRDWLASAGNEEELELLAAIDPPRGDWKDGLTAAAMLAVVIAASTAMERTASSLGVRWGVASIVVGGVVLAAVTSLPNAVAAVYLARRGRASATLAEAMNSNTLNVIVGLLAPAVVVGVGRLSHNDIAVAAWYGGLTVLALGLAWAGRGLGRRAGALIIAVYVVFVVVLVMTT